MDKIEKSKPECWDKIWQDADFDTKYDEIFRHYDLGTKLKYVTGRCLECGCGMGHFVKFFIDCGRECWGVDSSIESVKTAKKHNPLAGICLADVSAMPYDDGFFDSIISLGVIEHTSKPELLVNEMRRCLKIGGILYITVPNRWHIYNLQQKWMKLRGTYTIDYCELYSKARLAKLLKDCGFELVEYIPRSDLATYMMGYVARRIK